MYDKIHYKLNKKIYINKVVKMVDFMLCDFTLIKKKTL